VCLLDILILICWLSPRHVVPLTEETRLKIFGSPDYPVFLDSLLSDGDCETLFDGDRETPFEMFGTPEKTCLICTGTPVKTRWKFCQS